jgi:hypothetical protein
VFFVKRLPDKSKTGTLENERSSIKDFNGRNNQAALYYFPQTLQAT